MKAVIKAGGKQYIVEKGDKLDIEFVGDEKELSFDALMLIDKEPKVGKPIVEGAKVKAKVLATTRDPKVTAIRYKAKKRVHKRRGHKQLKSSIEITSVTGK